MGCWACVCALWRAECAVLPSDLATVDGGTTLLGLWRAAVAADGEGLGGGRGVRLGGRWRWLDGGAGYYGLLGVRVRALASRVRRLPSDLATVDRPSTAAPMLGR